MLEHVTCMQKMRMHTKFVSKLQRKGHFVELVEIGG